MTEKKKQDMKVEKIHFADDDDNDDNEEFDFLDNMAFTNPYEDEDEDKYKDKDKDDSWIEKMWKEDDEQEKTKSIPLFLHPWKTTSALISNFDEFNNGLGSHQRDCKTLKEKIGSLCMDGTITVNNGIGVYINRALYKGQPVGDLLPMGHYCSIAENVSKIEKVETNQNYLRVYNKKIKKQCICHKDADIHFSSYLTFSHDIYECNLAVLDDLSLIVIHNIFQSANKEISFTNPVKAVCYLGNWVIK